MPCTISILSITGFRENESSVVHRIEVSGITSCAIVEACLTYPGGGGETEWVSSDVVTIQGEWVAVFESDARNSTRPDFDPEKGIQCGIEIEAHARCADGDSCQAQPTTKLLECENLFCPTSLGLAVSDENGNQVDPTQSLEPGTYLVEVVDPAENENSSENIIFFWRVDDEVTTAGLSDDGRTLRYELVSNQHEISVVAEKDYCVPISESIELQCTAITAEEAPPPSIEPYGPSDEESEPPEEEAPPPSTDPHGPDSTGSDDGESPQVHLDEVDTPVADQYPDEEDRSPPIPASDEFDFNCFLSTAILALALITAFSAAGIAICVPIAGVVAIAALVLGLIAYIAAVTGCDRCTVLKSLVWAIDVTIFIFALEIPVCAIAGGGPIVPIAAVLILVRRYWLIPAIRNIPGCEEPGFFEVVPPFATRRRRRQRFNPNEHGFNFDNEFEVAAITNHWPFDVDDAEIPDEYGLCAGMCWLARDYYQADRPIPAQDFAPEPGDDLYQHLLDRQLDSYGPGGLHLLQNLWHTGLSDNVVRQQTASELDRLLPLLDAMVPVNIALILKSGEELISEVGSRNPDAAWVGHAVIAYDYESRNSGDVHVHIYDPNYANNGSVRIRTVREVISGNPEISCAYACPMPSPSWSANIRGFFIEDRYSFKEPE